MAFYCESGADISGLEALSARQVDGAQVPLATDIAKGIPVYDGPALEAQLTGAGRDDVLAEWAWVFGQGPGVLVIRQAQVDHDAIDAATDLFNRIIAEEAGGAGGGADHFAAAGNNARLWNAAQKLCLADPALFARYHGSVAIDAVCEAWLGPAYQMTAQVNLVRPGGRAQEAHRDYHLGFQTAEAAARFPAHVHDLSPLMTLQGALAHCDMPVESGTTKLLPWSQQWGPGYVAMRRDDVRALFEARCVQLELAKGDALWFNPACFHGAGDNVSTDIQRFANLFQVGSAMGRVLEALDRDAMARALYPVLKATNMDAARTSAAIAAAAEGYPFPTNLDTDPPVGGLAPESQAALMRRALDEGMGQAEFEAALTAQSERKRP